MVVENLRVFKVKSYKQLFKMYQNDELGIIEQRMPNNLQPLKPSETLSELECIQSLLETDYDFPYHVYFDGKKYIITILGFNISKVIDDKKQLIQFGEDGIWQEEAEIKEGDNEEDLEWQDSSNGSFEMWGMYNVAEHKPQNLAQILKEKTVSITGIQKLEIFRDILFNLGYDTLIEYDDTFKDSKEMSVGYVHYKKKLGFFMSKNTFFKKEEYLSVIKQLTKD